MAHGTSVLRYIFGFLFIAITFIFFILASSQMWKSRAIFSEFSSHKIKLTIRVLNHVLSVLLLLLALIDLDFWIWNSHAPKPFYYIYVLNKAFVDIIICITGCNIAYNLIQTFYISKQDIESFPKHARIMWWTIAISFAFVTIMCCVLGLSLSTFILISLYSNIRILYLCIAMSYLSYTFYFIFWKYDPDVVKNKKYALYFAIFAILSFIFFQIIIIQTFTAEKHTLKDVATSGFENGKNLSALMFVILGWAGYLVVLYLLMKFVWVKSNSGVWRRDGGPSGSNVFNSHSSGSSFK